eukprot:356995-Chlamydomonas_euryale.AAC.23
MEPSRTAATHTSLPPPPAGLRHGASACAHADACLLSCAGLDDLGLYQPTVTAPGKIVDWGAPLRDAWRASESEALHVLDTFLSQTLPKYEAQRGHADARGVSKLSPYLRWGQLSPRLMCHRMEEAK